MSESKGALGRLTAREVHGTAALQGAKTAESDKEAALSRIIGELNVSIMGARFVYDHMVRHLQESDLTVNFFPHKFFNSVPKGSTYDNQFGGNSSKWGDAGYLKDRNEAEEKMFDFSQDKDVLGKMMPKGCSVPNETIDRIKKYGQFDTTSVDFNPIVRPKYAALNYLRNPRGAASQWGTSFLVFKSFVKHNCTYVETDSFDFALSTRGGPTAHLHLATYLDWSRLLVNLSPFVLKAVYDLSRGMTGITVNVGSTCYIEAHLHGDVQFSRDIEKIVVSKSDIDDAANKKYPDYLKKINAKTLRANMEKFCKKHGIPIEEAA